MDIMRNSANIVSVVRVFIAFGAIALLFRHTQNSYILAFILTAIAFSMDAVDGFLARKYGQASQLGAVLDIMGDRIVEAIYWIVFAVLGWIPVIFPLICVARAFVTDGIRSVALTKGMTPFGMQTTEWGKFICASKFMKTSYAVAKVAAYMLLIVAYTPDLPLVYANPVKAVAVILAWIAIIFCGVRAVPVVAESGKLFE
ncbi:MAG: CDP-alcohol phosphatidyltransferase family protein [Alphaproteobacteria bacterium]|nr:CDP-alcohol phosphatidyltransferase family protein [Alphaproteobacteria bacterium]